MAQKVYFSHVMAYLTVCSCVDFKVIDGTKSLFFSCYGLFDGMWLCRFQGSLVLLRP